MRYGKISAEGSLDVTGSLSVVTGLSGSLTKLTDGTSYLVAGNNVTITSQSNGSVLIAASGGGGGGGDSFFSSTTNDSIFTTGSVAFRGGDSAIDSPYDVGSDVFFYVSGSISGNGANDKKSLFGGDVRISGSVSQGFDTLASGSYSHAEGAGSTASGDYSHAEGAGTTASGGSSHAEGSGTTASGGSSHAEGNGTTASGDYSHAEGDGSTAPGPASHAEGGGTVAYGIGSHAEGSTTVAGCLGYYSTDAGATIPGLIVLDSAYGDVSGQFSPGDYILLEDWFYYNTYTFASFEIASVTFNSPSTEITLVDNTVSTASGAAIGKRGVAAPSGADNKMGYYSHAEGNTTLAQAIRSHAEGEGTVSSGKASHAEGVGTTASGNYSHAEGDSTTASGDYSHAEGYGTTASGNYSHAEGDSTTASGGASHAEGAGTTASGSYSHAEGSGTTASGDYSHAEGYQTTASGSYSHAEGLGTTASGVGAHAEGGSTTASGNGSHAEGNGTTTSGNYSHAEGDSTTASGLASHAEGQLANASGDYSHAEGNGTQAGWRGFSSTDAGDSTNGLIVLDSGYGDVTGSISAPGTIILDDTGGGNNYGFKFFTFSSVAFNSPSTEIILDDATVSTTSAVIGIVGSLNLSIADQAMGTGAHAEGTSTVAYRDYSHAEGVNTTASGQYSHAEGDSTTASGTGAHAEGTSTTASGLASHAEGLGTIASGSYQHVGGKYNLRNNDFSLFVIGDGTGDADANRSDIVRVNPGANPGFGQFQVTGSITVSGSYLLNVVSGTSNPTYNVGSWEHVVVFTNNNVTGVLPPTSAVGTQIIFKDGTGTAGTSGGQMLSSSAGKIDGSATYTMPSINYTSVAVIKIKASPEEWIIV